MRLRAKVDRPPLAPLDKRGREIHNALDLIKPEQSDDGTRDDQYGGYCGMASEAYLYLAGGRESGLKVKRLDKHWWLEGPAGVIDLTLGPRDRRHLKAHPKSGFPYKDGEGAMFRGGYDRPSKRARVLIDLVRQQK